MESTLTTYISLTCVSGVLNFFLCTYVYLRKERIQGATPFMLYTLALSIYCFGYAIGLTSSTMEQLMFWTAIEYIGMPVSVPLGLYVVMQYLGKQPRLRYTSMMFIIPIITLILVSTNSHHHLYYKSIVEHTEYGLPFVEIEIGPWYVVQGIFTFGGLFYGFIILAARLIVAKNIQRTRIVVLLCGQLVPMVTAFLYLVGATPAGIDPVPIVMCITSALYIWAIFSANMLSLLPIAKDTIFNNMSEGVFVLDTQQRLVEFNTTANRMFPSLHKGMIGYNLDRLWYELTGAAFPQSPESNCDELIVNNANGVRYFQLRTSILEQYKQQTAGSLIMLIDVTELKTLQHELEQQAYYDGLTKIYNRAQFYKLMKQQLENEQGTPVSLILFDIDHFKSINDNYGHHVGDHLLTHISSCCQQLLPKQGYIARYGGEEFVIALIDYSLEQARSFAEKVRAYIYEHPLHSNGLEIRVSASFGVAQLNRADRQTLQAALVRADQALYQSKRNGRNMVSIYA